MDTLPCEIWLKIFSYLELSDIVLRVPRVCKQWKAVAEDDYAISLKVQASGSILDFKFWSYNYVFNV